VVSAPQVAVVGGGRGPGGEPHHLGGFVQDLADFFMIASKF